MFEVTLTNIREEDGINCHGRGTSCPDQLARALKILYPIA